jgi:predicted amidophosphoribosyltransferase
MTDCAICGSEIEVLREDKIPLCDKCKEKIKEDYLDCAKTEEKEAEREG